MLSRRALFGLVSVCLILGGAATARANDSITLGLASPGPLADPVYEAVAEAKEQA
jgi:hypothetical protein